MAPAFDISRSVLPQGSVLALLDPFLLQHPQGHLLPRSAACTVRLHLDEGTARWPGSLTHCISGTQRKKTAVVLCVVKVTQPSRLI